MPYTPLTDALTAELALPAPRADALLWVVEAWLNQSSEPAAVLYRQVADAYELGNNHPLADITRAFNELADDPSTNLSRLAVEVGNVAECIDYQRKLERMSVAQFREDYPRAVDGRSAVQVQIIRDTRAENARLQARQTARRITGEGYTE